MAYLYLRFIPLHHALHKLTEAMAMHLYFVLILPPSLLDVNAVSSDLEITYDLKCQSDPLRVTKHMKTFGFSISPASESEAALLMSDGRILCWSLITVEHSQKSGSSKGLSQLSSSPLYSPGGAKPVTVTLSSCRPSGPIWTKI